MSLAVAAVPEGLPFIATVAELAAARRLSTRETLVRNPSTIEALGRVDVLCFDKTGTLTENRLRVTQVHPASGHSRDEVLRWAAHAAPSANGGPHVHATDRAIIEAAAAGASPNGAHPVAGPDARRPGSPGSAALPIGGPDARRPGSPGSAALPIGAADAHLPFRSGRSFSASVTGADLTVKGAPEVVLAACLDAGKDAGATVHRARRRWVAGDRGRPNES